MTSKPESYRGPGRIWRQPAYCPDGVRHKGGVILAWALVLVMHCGICGKRSGGGSCTSALEGFKNFYISTNNELKVFARTNGVDDVHELSVSDLVTDSRLVAEYAYAGIDHV